MTLVLYIEFNRTQVIRSTPRSDINKEFHVHVSLREVAHTSQVFTTQAKQDRSEHDSKLSHLQTTEFFAGDCSYSLLHIITTSVKPKLMRN